MAAKLGIALRLSARSASRRKKIGPHPWALRIRIANSRVFSLAA